MRTNCFRVLPVLALASAAFFSTPASGQGGPNDSVWIQLFDKTNTSLATDWDIKITGSALNVDPRNTFRWAVVGSDTVLEVSYSNYTGSFSYGHAGYKHRPFSYYLLRGDYQVWGSQVAGNPGSWAVQNNGFMLHSQSVASMTTNQDFPISIEAQLLGPGNNSAGGGSASASTMNLCTPGTAFYNNPTGGGVNTNHCTPSRQGLPRAALNTGWQKVSALILGDSLHQYYAGSNGTDSVLRYYRPVYYAGSVANPPAGTPSNGTPLTGGYITIQSESHPYRFRKIEVLNLSGCMTPTDANYKTYFVHNDTAACGQPAGIRSPREVRYAAPMTVIGNAIHIGGTGRVTVEAYDMRGAQVGRHTAQAPFQWSPTVKNSGVHAIRVITPAGVYTQKATLF